MTMATQTMKRLTLKRLTLPWPTLKSRRRTPGKPPFATPLVGSLPCASFLERSSCLYPLSGAKTIDGMVRTKIAGTASADTFCLKFAIPQGERLTLRFPQTLSPSRKQEDHGV